jgi:hypothetical protein
MKKVIALLAVSAFALAFVACGQKTETAVEESTEPVEEVVDSAESVVDSTAMEVDAVVDSAAAE